MRSLAARVGNGVVVGASSGSSAIRASTASPTSRVVAVPPRSAVGAAASVVVDRQLERARVVGPAERVPEQQRHRAEHRRGIRDPTARDLRRRAVHRLEEPRPLRRRARRTAARPSPPVTAAATSERMSPNVFSVTTTSIVSGAFTIVIANESTSAWSSGTSGYSPAPISVTTSRQSREVWRTFTLSTEVSRPPRSRAIAKAAPGDPLDLGPRVLAGVEPRAVVARRPSRRSRGRRRARARSRGRSPRRGPGRRFA